MTKKCFGKKDSYLMKCWQAHNAKNCELVEKCYQKYLKAKNEGR